jgi:hypothetical protein
MPVADALVAARRDCEAAESVVGDAQELPFTDGAFDAALIAVLEDDNDADDGTAAVRCEYLQVVAVRR